MKVILVALILFLFGAGLLAARILRRRNVDLIVRASMTRRAPDYDGPRHVFFCVVDHFEPFWKNDDLAVALTRVRAWRDRYPRIAEGWRDRGGRPPRHTFFYPAEDYERSPACVEMLAEIVRLGAGDVEVHLHHHQDSADALRARLAGYTHALRAQHGLLHDGAGGKPVFAFIHGNWVLGNSGQNGAGCGVDDELRILDEAGCYADFTFPAAPHPSQPPVINRIYYPAGNRSQPRAHFIGIDARLGVAGGPGPLLITGPLGLNWKQRRRGFMPALENGDLTGLNPPSPDRVDAWMRASIGVAGFPRWTFVKTHTHGAQERNFNRLLGDGPGSLPALFADLVARYNDGERYTLHFSTPWEMYRAVKVLEANDTRAIEAIERFEYRF